MAILHCSVQFPQQFLQWLRDLNPMGGNHALTDLFSDKLISSDVVSAYEVMFEVDRELLTNQSDGSFRFMCGVLVGIAPQHLNVDLPNFGRLIKKKESMESKGKLKGIAPIFNKNKQNKLQKKNKFGVFSVTTVTKVRTYCLDMYFIIKNNPIGVYFI